MNSNLTVDHHIHVDIRHRIKAHIIGYPRACAGFRNSKSCCRILRATQRANRWDLLFDYPSSGKWFKRGQQHIAMDTAPELFVREVLAFLTDES